MPVTAKLSRKFYETFGDDVVNELVALLNGVDATYRLELRELNELNFARFDAKLEQRVAQLDAKIEQRIAELRAELRTEFERRFTALDAKLEQRTAELRAELREGLATLEGRMVARLGVIEGRFGTLEGRLVRWMFVFWAASVGTSIALIQVTR